MGSIIDPKHRIGIKKQMNNGQMAKIIKYTNAFDITIEFEDGVIREGVAYSSFKNGQVRNCYNDKTLGVGICNIKTKDRMGKLLPFYRTWFSMLNRCYNEKYQSKEPTYKGCSVCDNWLTLSNFKKWYDDNYYEINGEQMELDKDILFKGNKIYSPETCIFVPKSINGMFSKNKRVEGLPMGVHRKCSGFEVNPMTAKGRVYLGVFKTLEEAFQAYKQTREEYIKHVADQYKDRIPQKLYDALFLYKIEITD